MEDRTSKSSSPPEISLAAIVLAAGRSSRMAPHNKLLLQQYGETVLRSVVRNVLQCIDEVSVVVRHDSEASGAALVELRVRIVRNRDADEGMASSIRAGLNSLKPARKGVLIALGDMPCVTSRHLSLLIDAFRSSAVNRTVVPTFAARRGNPILWCARYFRELQSLKGDIGARHLLIRDAADLIAVEMPDDGVLIDVDTPDDWQQLTGGSQIA